MSDSYTESTNLDDIQPPEEPKKPKAKKVKASWLTWINLFLLTFIIVCLNYIGCTEYYRRDLTEDQRYDISPQSVNLLDSDLIQKRETPIKITFAFLRTTQNYKRMRSLIGEYERLSNGKIIVDFFDPLRQPNKAREVALIYGIDFKKNQVIIDARQDTQKGLDTFEGNQADAAHVRLLDGNNFIIYGPSPDGKGQKAVALQLEDMITANLYGAATGEPKVMYVVADKSNFSNENLNDDKSIFQTLNRICRSLNLQLVPLHLSGLEAIPNNAAGVLLIGPQYDITPEESKVLEDYWARNNAAMLVMLDPQAENLRHFYRFLRTQGVRPQNDRVMLKDRKKSVFEISTIFAPGLNSTKEFWNSSTGLEGQSISLQADTDDSALGFRRIQHYPLLITTPDFYGETRYTQFPVEYDENEDNNGPLMIATAVERGNSNDENLSKETGRMAVVGNVDMLQPKSIKSEQRDFLRSVTAWMTDREELSGIGARHDLTVKLNLDPHAVSFVEFVTTLGFPILALLMALLLWNIRRH